MRTLVCSLPLSPHLSIPSPPFLLTRDDDENTRYFQHIILQNTICRYQQYCNTVQHCLQYCTLLYCIHVLGHYTMFLSGCIPLSSSWVHYGVLHFMSLFHMSTLVLLVLWFSFLVALYLQFMQMLNFRVFVLGKHCWLMHQCSLNLDQLSTRRISIFGQISFPDSVVAYTEHILQEL